ncbi:unnamed protein product [Caenorhabditis auriculariae]|uniref:LITAF domain-containing protein n=1 Tax=Caenorhabditis auriculariae TaxID=2777116 RepID=A0A8S1HKC7_9PELO|nr:unnamed protein product [Caenorhabditis auriculariae]
MEKPVEDAAPPAYSTAIASPSDSVLPATAPVEEVPKTAAPPAYSAAVASQPAPATAPVEESPRIAQASPPARPSPPLPQCSQTSGSCVPPPPQQFLPQPQPQVQFVGPQGVQYFSPPQMAMAPGYGMMSPPNPYMMCPQMYQPPAPSQAPINVVVNSNANAGGGGGGGGGTGGAGGGLGGAGGANGGGGALVCPKCRKGIISRAQARRRKMVIMCLSTILFPCTCGLLYCLLLKNYVDTCTACGKQYGHRGGKKAGKVNAVTL